MKIDPRVYSQILDDARVSNGAYRLWQKLRGMTGDNECCWPSVRFLAKSLHCSNGAILRRLDELAQLHYLHIETGNRHKSSRYYIATGVDKMGTPCSAMWTKQTHDVDKTGTVGVDKMGTELNKPINNNNSRGRHAHTAQPPLARMNGKEVLLRLQQLREAI